MLKLYTPTEIASSKATELARDVMRTADIKKALDKARTELNDTNDSFDLALANQRVKWLKEQEEALIKIEGLSLEVKKLQKEKDQLLIPIDLERKRVDNIITEAQAMLVDATDKQKRLDELTEVLEDRLDGAMEQEQTLTEKEKTLFVKEENLKAQEIANARITKDVNERMQSFLINMEDKEKDFNTRKTALDLRDITLQEKERELVEREAQIIKDKQLIYSQRMALQAALQLKK